MGGLADFIENADRFLIPDRPRLAGDLDWMARANCQGRTALFFSDRPNDREQAKALCLHCPVLIECAGWRYRVRPKHGVWAGGGSARRLVANGRQSRAPRPNVFVWKISALSPMTSS